MTMADEDRAPRDAASTTATSFVGRGDQVRKLRWLLGSEVNDRCPPLLVHGPETTGKTAVVREVLRQTGRPVAYTSARACANARNLIGSALVQLREQGWLGDRAGLACSGTADLLNVLRSAKGSDIAAYWVIDDVETLVDGSRNTESTRFLQFLVQLRHFNLPCNLNVVLVSRVSWDSFQQGCSHEENSPTGIFFPAYTVQQLQEILMGERQTLVPKSTPTVTQGEDGEDEGRREWKRFLSIVVPAVSQYTGSIHMLRYLCSKLFASFDKSDRFGSRLQRVIQHMRARGISNVTLAEFFERDRVSQVQSGADFASLDSHSQAFVSSLPYLGKLLLLSAYVAGWNPHTSDNRVFGRTKTVKRRRKDPQLMNRKAEKVQEAKLAGPGTFTVDRLMAILRSLFKLEGTYLEDADLMDEFERDGGERAEDYIRSKVHSQETYQMIKTFTSQSLLSPGSVDSGSMCSEHYRLQCNLKESAALKIAKSLGIQLADYLVYV